MSIITRFFPAKTAITAAAIRAEIARSENEIIAQRAKLGNALAGVAAMSDAEHVAAEGAIASIERAIVRLEARVSHLNTELPTVIEAEAAAAKAVADEALRQRAEAARRANAVEAKKLLADYDKLAAQIGDILAKLGDLDTEREAVNEALRRNPVAERVLSYTHHHRKHPDRQAGEQRAMRKFWVYRYPTPPRDTEKLRYQDDGERENVREATIGPDGNVIPAASERYNYYGRELVIVPTLEEREVVVSQTTFRLGALLHGLSDVRLPPGTIETAKWHWPRQS